MHGCLSRRVRYGLPRLKIPVNSAIMKTPGRKGDAVAQVNELSPLSKEPCTKVIAVGACDEEGGGALSLQACVIIGAPFRCPWRDVGSACFFLLLRSHDVWGFFRSGVNSYWELGLAARKLGSGFRFRSGAADPGRSSQCRQEQQCFTARRSAANNPCSDKK